MDSKRDTPALKEVIVAGLDGKIYFLDLADGQPTRDAIDVGYPMKGSVSLNAYGMPVMAVGQYARKMKSGTGDIGVRFYNLLNQKQLYLLDGLDGKLKRPISEDGAFDTSVLFDRTNDGVVAAGSNGLLYTLDMGTEFDANQGSISISPKARVLSAKVSGQKSKGVKVLSSMAMYENYAYYADMTGVLHCVDTTTMQTVWAVKTGDAVQAAVALDFDDDGHPVGVYGQHAAKPQQGHLRHSPLQRHDRRGGLDALRSSKDQQKERRDPRCNGLSRAGRGQH